MGAVYIRGRSRRRSDWVEASTASHGFELPRTREAAWLARQQLVDWAAADLDARELADAKLLASELVTNALVHGHGRIMIRTELDDNHLLIEVIDEGNGFERLARKRDFHRAGAFGLQLVDAVASRSGISEDSSHVWFELDRRAHAQDPPANIP